MRTYSCLCEHARYPPLRVTVLVVHEVLALFLQDWRWLHPTNLCSINRCHCWTKPNQLVCLKLKVCVC